MEELKIKVAYKIGFLTILKYDQNIDESTRLTAHGVESTLKNFLSNVDKFNDDEEIMYYISEKESEALKKCREQRSDLKAKGEWLAYALLFDML